MNKSTHALLALAVGGAALLSGCVTAPSGGNLGVLDQAMRQADTTAAVALAVNPPQVRVGETITVQLGSAKPGYLYVYQLGTDGKTLTIVFPNAMDGANYLPGGGVAASLPRSNWRLAARGPAGVGYLLAIVSDKQQDLNQVAASVAAGTIRVDGPYGAALAALREVAP